jgi:hypothetical protein
MCDLTISEYKDSWESLKVNHFCEEAGSVSVEPTELRLDVLFGDTL